MIVTAVSWDDSAAVFLDQSQSSLCSLLYASGYIFIRGHRS